MRAWQDSPGYAMVVELFPMVIGFLQKLQMSWRKLDLGCSLQWIGWRIVLADAPKAFLPTEKLDRIVVSLRNLCAAPRTVSRKDLQTLVGRLVWYVHGAYWLKPWMQIWFFALHKPKLRFQMLSAEQIAELAEVLDNNGRVLRRCHLSDVQPGWKVLEVGNRCVTSAADVLGIPLKQHRVWVKLGEDQAEVITLSKAEVQVAQFFLQLLSAQEQVPVHLVESTRPQVLAAADAFAEGDRAGIGGWWLPCGEALDPANIH